MNISSAIVHARPGHLEAVRHMLGSLDGVEVHAASDEGKLIVTIETPGDRETTDTFETIGRMDHVLSASLVFHQTESDPESEVSVPSDPACGAASQSQGDPK